MSDRPIFQATAAVAPSDAGQPVAAAPSGQAQPEGASPTDQQVAEESAVKVGQETCAETKISNHACNSLHASVAFDGFGNAGVVWHDTRDGVFEIYFSVLTSSLKSSQTCDIARKASAQNRVVGLTCAATGEDDRVFTLASRCSAGGS